VSNLELLKTAFAVALSLPPDVDAANTRFGETAGWDSVAHMALVAEIENTFDIMLETDQVIGMSSFGKALEIVASHGIVLQPEE